MQLVILKFEEFCCPCEFFTEGSLSSRQGIVSLSAVVTDTPSVRVSTLMSTMPTLTTSTTLALM